MRRPLIWLVRQYQKRLSPHLGDNCRFSPSCSEYMAQSLETHGSVKGLLLGTWRILRCNPFGKVGYDPPPKKGTWRNPERKLRKE